MIWKKNSFTETRLLSGLCVALIFILFSIGISFSATYNVATNGFDTTGDGSPGFPWRTITNALAHSSSGDVINVGQGEFTDYLNITSAVTLTGADTYSAVAPYLQKHTSRSIIRTTATNFHGEAIAISTGGVKLLNLSIYGDAYSNGQPCIIRGISSTYRPTVISNCVIANIDGFAIRYQYTNSPPSTTDTDSVRGYIGYNMITNINGTNLSQIGIFAEFAPATVEQNELSDIWSNGYSAIYLHCCYFTTNMSRPLIVNSNFINHCVQGIWANSFGESGEKIIMNGNIITNGLIGVRVTAAKGQAVVTDNKISVSGISASGLTPARGIWIQADADPWNTTNATDHIVLRNSIVNNEEINSRSAGMYFGYDRIGGANNGVRATVMSNSISGFDYGVIMTSGVDNITVPSTQLVDVAFNWNDVSFVTAYSIYTTGFSYMVDASNNWLGFYTNQDQHISSNVYYSGSSTTGAYYKDTNNNGTNDYLDTDDDGDTILDSMEIVVGTKADRADSDRDGQDDWQEWGIAGTDPTNRYSAFGMTNVIWNTGISFSWPGTNARTYYIYRSTNLLSFGAPYTTLLSPTYNFSESPSGTSYYYKVTVSN